MVAVGVGNYKQSELELIATDPAKHVLTTTDFSKLVTLVKQLRKQTCESKCLKVFIVISSFDEILNSSIHRGYSG